MYTDSVAARIDAYAFCSSNLPNTALNDASWAASWTKAVIDRLKAHSKGASDSGVIYLPLDDILRVRLSDQPIARDGSPERGAHIACAADGSVVEVYCFTPAHSVGCDPT